MILYKDMKFDQINKFDCVVLSFSYKDGGGYTTVIPISSPEYREINPTQASVSVKKGFITQFDITSDHGDLYIVAITEDHAEEIELAIKSANDQGLLVPPLNQGEE